MCDAIGAKDYIKRIPFKLYSLAEAAEKGSCLRELILTVGDAIGHDVEKCMAKIDELEKCKP